MENFTISIGAGSDMQVFDVRNNSFYGDEGESSEYQFEVLRDGNAVLSLIPDGDTLRTGNNVGGLDEELIHRIIDKIESHLM